MIRHMKKGASLMSSSRNYTKGNLGLKNFNNFTNRLLVSKPAMTICNVSCKNKTREHWSNNSSKITVEVHPVDVGQGDCCFVVFKGVKEPLVDGGERADYVIMIDGGVEWQGGREKVNKFLGNVESKMEKLGILEVRDPKELSTPRTLTADVMIATHADKDHYTGIQYFTNRVNFNYNNFVVCSLDTFNDLINGKDVEIGNDIWERQMFGEIGLLTPDNFATQLKLPFCIEDKVKILNPNNSPLLLLGNKLEWHNGRFSGEISFHFSPKQQKATHIQKKVRDVISKRYKLLEAPSGIEAREDKKVERERLSETFEHKNSKSSLMTLIGNISSQKNLLIFTGDNQLLDVATVMCRNNHKEKRLTFARERFGMHVSKDSFDRELVEKIVQRREDKLSESEKLPLLLLQVPHHGSSVLQEELYSPKQFWNNNGTASVFYELISFYLKFPANNYLINAGNLYNRNKRLSVAQMCFPKGNFGPDFEYGHPHPSTVMSIMASIKSRSKSSDRNVRIYCTNEAALASLEGGQGSDRHLRSPQKSKLARAFEFCGIEIDSTTEEASMQVQKRSDAQDKRGVQLVEFFHMTENGNFHKHCEMFRSQDNREHIWYHRSASNTLADGAIKFELDRT